MNKPLYSFLIPMIIMLVSSGTFAQNYYSVLGSSKEIRWVIRIEVVDSESHTPIKNVSVTLSDEPGKPTIFTLGTNSSGIAIIIVKEVQYIPGIGKLKVVAPGYKFWTKEIQQWDFVENEKNRMLYLTNLNPWSWTDLNAVPSDRDIIDEITKRNYRIWTDHNTAYIAPGIFEFNVTMEKIPNKIDLDESDYEK